MLAEENIWSAGFDYLISPAADISGWVTLHVVPGNCRSK